MKSVQLIYSAVLLFIFYAHSQPLDILNTDGTLCSAFNSSCTLASLDSLRSTIENHTKSAVFFNSTVEDTSRGITVDNPVVDQLSDQIRTVLKHFHQPQPIGIPGQEFLSEPTYAPDANGSLVMATGYFYNITIWGLSNFSVESIETRLDDMEVFVALHLNRILIKGDYLVDNLLTSSSGPFNITLYNVTGMGTVDLEIDQAGKIYTNKSITDMTYDSIEVILNDISSILQPFVSTCGFSILEAEKAHILGNVNERVIIEINKRLFILPKIPNLVNISPIDLAVLEGRKFVRTRFEPFIISNIIDFQSQFIKAYIGPVTIHGLSKFSRVGNVTVSMKNRTVIFVVRLFTGRLLGDCKWSYDFADIVGFKRNGQSNFTVEHVQIEATVHQSIDSRKSPKLQDFQVETGTILVKMDGQGNFDYIVEMATRMLPRMLRYVIIDALEEPVKQKIQSDLLDKINVYDFIEQHLSEIKNFIAEKL